jgi:3-oxoacyl-[acyl-carrier-protein] synthase II
MRRAVVTGIGAVTPFGLGVDRFWDGLVNNRNAIRRVQSLPLSGGVVHIAGELPSVPSEKLSPLSCAPEDPSIRVFFEAVREAVGMSGLSLPSMPNTDRVGMLIADRGMGQILYLDSYAPLLQSCCQSSGRVDEERFFAELGHVNLLPWRWETDPDSINHVAARELQVSGPQLSLSTACASSSSAIGEATIKIRRGDIDAAIVGGAYNFDLHAMVGFTRIGALTVHPDPEYACRPFDADRSGFVMGSGCGILVLEEMTSARQRGARILCEVTGYGACGDAFRATDPDPEANGIVRTIQACLASGHIGPDQVDYINAHGTSTKMNDFIETIGIKHVFGERSRIIPVSSTKSMIGHSIMAAGALEGIASIKSICTGIIHPTHNWQRRDPDLDLDYVPDCAREKRVRHVLSNSFGFGGQNVSLLFSAFSS